MPEINITDTHADFAQRTIQWRKIRDVIEGEDQIKDQGQAYLPKPSGQTTAQYKAYVARASFYPVGDRTLRGLAGMVFRHQAALEMPERMDEMRENLTTDMYSFDVLTEEVVRELLSVGRYGILVDFPMQVASADTLPHFATYFAEDIVNWRQAFIEGKKMLTRVVLRDDIDNTFGNDTVRYLELLLNPAGLYTVNVWQAQVTQGSSVTKGGTREFTKTSSTIPEINGKPLNFIPFTFFNPYDLRPGIEKPPMADLASMNVAHYRNSADYEHALFLTACPTPWIAGGLDEATKPKSIGSAALWTLPENTKVGMLEFSGMGLMAQQKAMDDKENRMAALGARMIKDNSVVRQETSQTSSMRGRGEMSLLTSVAHMTQAGLEQAFKWAAEFVGASPDEIKVIINRDFVDARLDAKDLEALVKTWQSGAISRDTMHRQLQKGEIIEPSRDVDEEKELIDSEGEATGQLMALSEIEKLEADTKKVKEPPPEPAPIVVGQTPGTPGAKAPPQRNDGQ
jgi:hypothetical protein